MPPTVPLRTEEVLQARHALSKGNADRSATLAALRDRPIRSARTLREWHDLMLFLEAYPRSTEEHRIAQAELERVAVIASALMARSESGLYGLINTGLARAPLQSTFSYPLVDWMVREWPGAVELFQVDASLEELRELLRPLLPAVEQETLDQPVEDAYQLLEEVFGSSRVDQLKGLLSALRALPVSTALRTLLFARMQVYVKAEGAVDLSMSEVRGPIDAVHLRSGDQRSAVDTKAIISMPVGRPLRLRERDKERLVHTARVVLATLHRETEPITYPSDVELFDLGDGLRIGLYYLHLEQRLPFDSYVGFMAFKNGVPLAYGGAWIFPGRSKVGINVFPALRGGESAWFFAQLLRLYHHRFDVDLFEAENYQLGHHNPDGLKSGAYWFYYRLGFRPRSARHRRSAEQQFTRLSKDRSHQVPLPLLRELVEAGLELTLREPRYPLVDTAALTRAVQRHVVERYTGDRTQALAAASERSHQVLPLGPRSGWSTAELHALALWSLVLDQLPDLERWPLNARKALVEVLRRKAQPNETAHQDLLRKQGRLLEALAALAPGG
jgi:hypothetical protein